MQHRLRVSMLMVFLIYPITGKEEESTNTTSSTKLLWRKILTTYIRQETPNLVDPTIVQVGFYIHDMSVSDMGVFSAKYFLRQKWHDPRLEFGPRNGEDSIIMDPRKIWLPDILSKNEETPSFHDATASNKLCKLNSAGHVLYMMTLSSTFKCNMEYMSYPFDTMYCPIIIESFKYDTSALMLSWQDTPVAIKTELELPTWSLQETSQHNCTQKYTTGTFPCIELRFKFTRDLGYFVKVFFIPDIIMVVMAMAALWVKMKPSLQYGLVFMPLFVMIIKLGGLDARISPIPAVKYMTSADVWRSGCWTVILLVLTDLVVFTVLSHNTSKGDGHDEGTKDIRQTRTERVEHVLKIALPLSFLFFNIIFWAVNLS